jgi:hypothetical protein
MQENDEREKLGDETFEKIYGNKNIREERAH